MVNLAIGYPPKVYSVDGNPALTLLLINLKAAKDVDAREIAECTGTCKLSIRNML